MSIGSALRALAGLARVALAALAFVVAPLADAVACSREDAAMAANAAASLVYDVAAEQSVEAVSNGAGHDGQLPGDAMHCIHGHCHHSASVKSADGGTQLMREGAADVVSRHVDLALSRAPAGLERPPKA